MTVARAAIRLDDPIGVGGDTRVDIRFYSDNAKKTYASIAGKTVVALVKDVGGSWKDYSVTAAAVGGMTAAGYFTITGASHSAGDADLQLTIDGTLKERWKFEFVAQGS